jgi:hypothetical protein
MLSKECKDLNTIAMSMAHTSKSNRLELKKPLSLGPQHRESAGDGMARMVYGNGSTVPGTPCDGLAHGRHYVLVLGSLLHCLSATRVAKRVIHLFWQKKNWVHKEQKSTLAAGARILQIQQKQTHRPRATYRLRTTRSGEIQTCEYKDR